MSFNGSYLLGESYILSRSEGEKIIATNLKYRQVVLPYINGKELYSINELSYKRMAICFWDWPEEKAKEYPLVYSWLLKNVKPQRDKVKRERRRKLWWIHAENNPGLYHAVGLGENFDKHPKKYTPKKRYPEKVICKSKSSSTWEFALLPSRMLFDQTVLVVASDCMSIFGQLQSTLHYLWALRQGSSLKNDLSYTASTVFETFPFLGFSEKIANRAKAYISSRTEFIGHSNCGLTGYYNLLHSVGETGDAIVRCREALAQLDVAVSIEFGFEDLDLSHGFYEIEALPEGKRTRFTLSDSSRNDVVNRLLIINKVRFSEEQVEGGSVNVLPRNKYRNPIDYQALDEVAEPKPQMDIFGRED